MATVQIGQQMAQWIQNVVLLWLGIGGTVMGVIGIIGGIVTRRGQLVLASLVAVVLIQVALPVGHLFYETFSTAPKWVIGLFMGVFAVSVIVFFANALRSLIKALRKARRGD